MEKILNITPKYYGYKDFPKDSEGKILLPRNKEGVIVIERKNTVNYGNGLLGLVDGSAIATSEWEQLRNCFVLVDDDGTEYFHWCIGGSSSGPCLGVSSFETNFDLYYEKINGKKKEIDDELSYKFEYGHRNEELIATGFQQLTKMKVVKDNSVFFNENTGFMQANVDYFVQHIDGEFSILEIKSTNSNNYQKINDYKNKKVPPDYYSQAVLHYPKVLGDVFKIKGTFFAVGYSNSLNDIIICHFNRDFEQEQKLFEAEKTFVDCLERKVPPEEQTFFGEALIEYLEKKYPSAQPKSCDLSERGIDAVNGYLSIQKQLDSLSAEQEQLKQDLLFYKAIILEEMEDCESTSDFEIGNEKFYVDYKNNSRNTIAQSVIKNKYPEIYDDVVKTSNYRTFSIKKAKKKTKKG